MGGTKIEALALDAAGREVFRKRVATPRGDYAATIAAVSSLVKELGSGSVGVGIPGAMSQVTGLVKNANSTWLIGQPLKQDLEKASAAKCASRTMRTASRCRKRWTGREGRRRGVRRDPRDRRRRRHRRRRKVIIGANAIAAKWGITRCPRRRCRPAESALLCGRTGCIETYLQVQASRADHEQRTGERRTPEKSHLLEMRAFPVTWKGWRGPWPA